MARAKPIVLAPDLALPLDAVTRTFGIFGQRETGKSTTGAVLVEGAVHAGGRSVVMDPTGVWFGLTRAGAGPGLPGVVLGGENADAPLEPTAGKVVAEFVISTDYPLVVLDMKLLRKHQRQHFAMEFLETLYHDNRDPLLVVMDEAAQFAPQQMREGGDVPRLLGAVEDLVKLGRSRGLGAAMIEQRIATLNANVREQIGTLVAHRLIGPLDRKALKDWINAQGEPEREAEALALISKLDPGTALVWSPAWIKFFGLVAMNNATTFDSRATPEVGKRRKSPGKRASVDLATLRVLMAETIEKQKANDPALLKKRVAELERELAKRPTEQAEKVVEVSLPPVEVPVLTAADRRAIEQVSRSVEQMEARIGKLMKPMSDALARVASIQTKFEQEVGRAMRVAPSGSLPDRQTGGNVAVALDRHRKRSLSIQVDATEPARPPAATAQSNGGVSGQHQRVLDAILWFEQMRITWPTRIQTGFVAGYKVSKKGGGTFAQVIADMTRDGLIEQGRGTLALTEAGRSLANDPGLPSENAEMHRAVLARLPDPEARILQVLIERAPDAISRVDLGAATGYQVTSKGGGTFAQLLSNLKQLGLIDYPRPAHVVALDVLFPMGGYDN